MKFYSSSFVYAKYCLEIATPVQTSIKLDFTQFDHQFDIIPSSVWFEFEQPQSNYITCTPINHVLTIILVQT